jgi:hypothetical protein
MPAALALFAEENPLRGNAGRLRRRAIRIGAAFVALAADTEGKSDPAVRVEAAGATSVTDAEGELRRALLVCHALGAEELAAGADAGATDAVAVDETVLQSIAFGAALAATVDVALIPVPYARLAMVDTHTVAAGEGIGAADAGARLLTVGAAAPV